MMSQLNGQQGTLKLRGRLGQDEVDRILIAIERIVARGCGEVSLDLAGVTHADFRALRPLFRMADRFDQQGHALRVTNMNDYIRDVFGVAFAGEGETLIDEPEAELPDVVNG